MAKIPITCHICDDPLSRDTLALLTCYLTTQHLTRTLPHQNVKDLNLGWCQIGASGIECIADMLKYNSTIQSLDLRANGLRDEGAICLARSLKVVNEALTSLNLGFNEIRDEGAFTIAQALKANEDARLVSLNLMNFLTKLGQSAITDARDHVYEMNEKELTIVF